MTRCAIAYNDIMAASVIRTLKGMGVSVPQQVSVVGFEDFFREHQPSPSLITIDTDMVTQARLGFDQLLARINVPSQRPRMKISVKPRLVIRESTAPPPL